jgi:hypothetical protein
MKRRNFGKCVAVAWMGLLFAAPSPGVSAPVFSVAGHERESAWLNDLLALHLPGARTRTSLWDSWLPMSTLWAATGEERSARAARDFYRGVLMKRPIDAEGYVSMQQHRGMAHSEGWPFPGWQQSTGVGWHFSLAGDGWAVQNFRQQALANADGWGIEEARVEGVDPERGLRLVATGDTVTLTTPAFSCGTIVAPFIRVEWAADGTRAGTAAVQWRLKGESEWVEGRQMEFAARTAAEGMGFANIPVHRAPGYDGLLTQVRLVLPGGAGARITLKSVITAIDTRHPVTNSAFIHACTDYFNWTTDLAFLRDRLPEMRRALAYALDEFDVAAGGHVHVRWVGHDGRSGLDRDAAGKRVLRPGLGVGNNYWDLLPFGGRDAFATMQLYVALRRMAALERDLAAHGAWGFAPAEGRLSAGALETLADAVRADFRTRFWDAETGRFIGWIDLDGGRHDFGFTFLNTEAMHHGLATPEQEQAIFDWLDGRRMVAGDTSQGADIFHWRFGPRSTTRRNTETYVWAWSHPESISWGDQVQDGGAVLGFTYFELMARLRVQGPDRAWDRLREVLVWFGEVQAEGGYRAYYAKPGRGTLQGGGPPGGLGFDHEFMESVLVPQVMLYGFLGVRPRPGGLDLDPRLPKAWPSVSVEGVQAQGQVFGLSAEPGAVTLTCRSGAAAEMALWLPDGTWRLEADGAAAGPEAATDTHGFAPGAPPWRLTWEPGQSRRFRRL